jgi:hypothetical protein
MGPSLSMAGTKRTSRADALRSSGAHWTRREGTRSAAAGCLPSSPQPMDLWGWVSYRGAIFRISATVAVPKVSGSMARSALTAAGITLGSESFNVAWRAGTA